MSLYIKSVLINFPQEFAKNVSYSYCSVCKEFTLADMNMVKLVNKLVLKFLIFNSLKEGFFTIANYNITHNGIKIAHKSSYTSIKTSAKHNC